MLKVRRAIERNLSNFLDKTRCIHGKRDAKTFTNGGPKFFSARVFCLCRRHHITKKTLYISIKLTKSERACNSPCGEDSMQLVSLVVCLIASGPKSLVQPLMCITDFLFSRVIGQCLKTVRNKYYRLKID
jgi:hypothetical protein